jgi:hypothetical protein
MAEQRLSSGVAGAERSFHAEVVDEQRPSQFGNLNPFVGPVDLGRGEREEAGFSGGEQVAVFHHLEQQEFEQVTLDSQKAGQFIHGGPSAAEPRL